MARELKLKRGCITCALGACRSLGPSSWSVTHIKSGKEQEKSLFREYDYEIMSVYSIFSLPLQLTFAILHLSFHVFYNSLSMVNDIEN